MKRNLILVSVLAAAMLLGGCAGLLSSDPSTARLAAQELATQLTNTQSALKEAQGQLDTAKAQIAQASDQGKQIAALQQQVESLKNAQTTRPADTGLSDSLKALQDQMAALAKQPASGVDEKQLKLLDAMSSFVAKTQAVNDTLVATAKDLSDKLAKATTPAEVKAAQVEAVTKTVQAGEQAIPGWGQIASLLTGLVGAGIAAAYRAQAARDKAAAVSMKDAIDLALQSGQMTATPAAVATVNNEIKDHPIANALVDVVGAAAK